MYNLTNDGDWASSPVDATVWYTAQRLGELGAGYANLNTATFDHQGSLWFTGQSGIFGRLDPQVGQIDVFQAHHGPGPYGISTTPNGTIYYSSLAGS